MPQPIAGRYCSIIVGCRSGVWQRGHFILAAPHSGAKTITAYALARQGIARRVSREPSARRIASGGRVLGSRGRLGSRGCLGSRVVLGLVLAVVAATFLLRVALVLPALGTRFLVARLAGRLLIARTFAIVAPVAA